MEQIIQYLQDSKNKGILALDLGKRKIGMAFANYEVGVILPLEVYNFKSKPLLLTRLQEIISEKQISLLVIGTNDLISTEAKADDANSDTIDFIAENISLPIILEDESFTTNIANSILKAHSFNREKRNEMDDMVAAALILENFINRLR